MAAVRARELGRGFLRHRGDRVRLTGDPSGRPDTPARIVAVENAPVRCAASRMRRISAGEKAIAPNAT